MVKLAIFDIDFTITKKETLMQFFRYAIKRDKKNIKFLPRAIVSGALYGVGYFDEKRVKETFLKFIDSIEEKNLQTLVKDFYRDCLSQILYKDALDMIKKLKSEGYLIYLISASPEFYIKEFYAIPEVDMIIGTRFEFKDGIFMRRMLGNNCKGKEKVVRLKEILKEKGLEVNYKESYMFSDSLSDLPLLELVGKPYLINYNKKYKEIENLNWR